MGMSAHARLSPSAAHRWMACAGSVRLTERLTPEQQDTSNRFSREGTLAHEIAEIMASCAVSLQEVDLTHERMDNWRTRADRDGFDADEMLMHAHDWAARMRQYQRDGFTVALEQRVSTGVPQSWGTADAVVYDEGLVIIEDFKYGKGVPVHADDNPQLMLYGLGVLEQFAPAAHQVQMTIWQPRVDGHHSTTVISSEDLRQWRDAVALPAARLALTHDAPVTPSLEACRFCPVAGVCVARTDSMLEQDFGDPEVMSSDELADVLGRLDDIEAWASAVRASALKSVKDGGHLPGWKLVRKHGRRKISDTEEAIRVLGPDSVRTNLRPLGELERLVGGKKVLTEKLGDLIRVVEGGEVLVPESDPRPVSDPGADFTD